MEAFRDVSAKDNSKSKTQHIPGGITEIGPTLQDLKDGAVMVPHLLFNPSIWPVQMMDAGE